MADGGLYFAYGSNINLDQMSYRCPAAQVVGPVTLDGYELLFRGSGVATIGPKEGAVVHGLLWKITPDCERSLDRYEGYPRLYGKQAVTVKDQNGQKFTVMAYVMTERYLTPAIPSGFYYQGIMDGYRQNGLPAAALKKAWNHAVREVHQETERANAGLIGRTQPPKRRGGHER